MHITCCAAADGQSVHNGQDPSGHAKTKKRSFEAGLLKRAKNRTINIYGLRKAKMIHLSNRDLAQANQLSITNYRKSDRPLKW